MKEPN